MCALVRDTFFFGLISCSMGYCGLSCVRLNIMTLRPSRSPLVHTRSNPAINTCNGPTNALVCNKTLIQMSHTKIFKITPTCFDHQMIIIRELLDPS
jgi:hypothetical protein